MCCSLSVVRMLPVIFQDKYIRNLRSETIFELLPAMERRELKEMYVNAAHFWNFRLRLLPHLPCRNADIIIVDGRNYGLC